MTTTALFREFHQALPLRAIAFFDTLSDKHMRARPQPMINSLAWLIWHMARVEDAGINRLVATARRYSTKETAASRCRYPSATTAPA